MRKQARTIGSHLREQVSDSLRSGGGLALATVAFIAVAREGLETGLFLFASTENVGSGARDLGGVAGPRRSPSRLGVAFYRGALRLDLHRFFMITGVLVIAFAAWLIYGGLHEFGELAGSELLGGRSTARLRSPMRLGFGAFYLRRPAGAGAPARAAGRRQPARTPEQSARRSRRSATPVELARRPPSGPGGRVRTCLSC